VCSLILELYEHPKILYSNVDKILRKYKTTGGKVSDYESEDSEDGKEILKKR
jgi:hypothetical protein